MRPLSGLVCAVWIAALLGAASGEAVARGGGGGFRGGGSGGGRAVAARPGPVGYGGGSRYGSVARPRGGFRYAHGQHGYGQAGSRRFGHGRDGYGRDRHQYGRDGRGCAGGFGCRYLGYGAGLYGYGGYGLGAGYGGPGLGGGGFAGHWTGEGGGLPVAAGIRAPAVQPPALYVLGGGRPGRAGGSGLAARAGHGPVSADSRDAAGESGVARAGPAVMVVR